MAEEKALKVEEVRAIIEACALHGVSVLKFGDLSLQMGPRAPQVHGQPAIPAAEIAVLQAKAAEEARVQDELRQKRDLYDELVITKPEVAEQMLLNGELEEHESVPADENPQP
jgi:hypothetical protein